MKPQTTRLAKELPKTTERAEAKKRAVATLVDFHAKSLPAARRMVADSDKRATRMVRIFSNVSWLDFFLMYVVAAIDPGSNPVATYEFLAQMEGAK